MHSFWHHPGIEPWTFRSQVGHANHYSTDRPFTNIYGSATANVVSKPLLLLRLPTLV